MAWDAVYYSTTDGSVPAVEFLASCPTKVAANLLAVLGGGKWEAMRGTMGSYYEVRATGPGREQFRLFCLLENAPQEELARRGLGRPAIAVITGLRKPWRTAFGEADYRAVRRLGEEHLSNYPRRIAT